MAQFRQKPVMDHTHDLSAKLINQIMLADWSAPFPLFLPPCTLMSLFISHFLYWLSTTPFPTPLSFCKPLSSQLVNYLLRCDLFLFCFFSLQCFITVHVCSM